MNKKLFVLGLILGTAFYGLSQSKDLAKADNYFQEKSYVLAAEEYKDVLGTRYESYDMKSNLAYCYFKMGKFQAAAALYKTFIDSANVKAISFYDYSYLLKMFEKYEESDKYMKKYCTHYPEEIRSKLFLKNPSYLEEINSIRPYFEVTNSTINSAHSDFGGYTNGNATKVYFLSSRPKDRFFVVKNTSLKNNKGYFDVFEATLSTDSSGKEAMGNSQRLKKLNSRYHEGPMVFSTDRKTVYFTRSSKSKNKDGVQNLKIMIANVDPSGQFYNIHPFPYNSDSYSVGHPALSPDGKILYFVSNNEQSIGGSDIFKVSVKPEGEFGEMIHLGDEINTEGNELFPFVDSKGRLFFSSDGRPGLGGLDVYMALIKNEKITLFSMGNKINSSYDDFAFVLSEDLSKGFVSSNRKGGKGKDDIYMIQAVRELPMD